MQTELDYKICTGCKLKKLTSEFPKDKNAKDGLHWQCKSCRSEYNKIYRARNPELIKKLDRNANIRKRGTTPELWSAKFVEQEGKCDICGVHQSDLTKSLATDHNHLTGKFRGLLCGTCNRGIGLLKDRIDILLKAADYLTKYSTNDPEI